jgi:uncharacterized cupin superfamily protein
MSDLKISVEKPTEEKLNGLKVLSWPVWTKGPSSFDWHYDEKECCFFLEGDVTVKTPSETVSFGKGDFVTFPRGLSCTWQVKKSVRKHYKFGE